MPTFLRKVYDRLSKNEDENSLETQLNRNVINEENDGITDDHAKIIEMSDTVMTFLNNRKYIQIYEILEGFYILYIRETSY